MPNRSRELSPVQTSNIFTPTGLKVTDPDMTFEEWVNIGRAIGYVQSGWQWWVGDWLLLGEDLFGEEAFQAIEATSQERYDVAQRTTGVEHGRMMNIVSVCRRVAEARRREDLTFTHHEKVAALEPDDQVEWLEKAVEAGWSTSELVAELKGLGEGGGNGSEPDTPPGPSRLERLEELVAHIYHQAQPTRRGVHEVPDELISQAGAAVGEE